MNNIDLVEWQKHSKNGLVYPWWTWNFLDVMDTWDFKDKAFLEFGAGLGTAFLRDKCKWVDSIEADIMWANRAEENCDNNKRLNGNIYSKQIADCVEGGWEQYIGLIPKETKYDVISIDGIYRTECIEWAINHFKGRDGILVLDNLDQDFVWISPKAMELLEPYEGEIFIQPTHTNHEGKPWNTRYYKIPA